MIEDQVGKSGSSDHRRQNPPPTFYNFSIELVFCHTNQHCHLELTLLLASCWLTQSSLTSPVSDLHSLAICIYT